MDTVALLDDCHATAADPRSRLYTGFEREHRSTDPATLEAVWQAVQADQRAGLHALVLADYEWGARLQRAGLQHVRDDASLRVLMFRRLQRMSRTEADAWLAADGDRPAGLADWTPAVDRPAFDAAIAAIHAAIAAGETYQVNYTYRVSGRAWGEPLALYRRLRARQPVAFGAFIALPEGRQVLSLSPELFVRAESGLATARPMKGTAARFTGPEADSETARHLAADEKNRAENLMIVDLLRNDLGRVARIGSVKVPSLFAVEPYATVFQMTSTVQAQLRPEVDFPGLLRALYPCGSITGAPKLHTMGLIGALENTPRGLYCGAIGWADAPAPGAACGDFCLSVAIRTLVLEADGRATLGVGAGIVKDSVAADEWDECRLKARFATELAPGFELFETVLATAAGEVPLLERHLQRLRGSAAALGFAFDEAAAAQALRAAAAAGEHGAGPRRLRLALAHDGRLTLTVAPLQPLAAGRDGRVRLRLAPEPLPAPDALSAHKTTRRAVYDAGVRAAEAEGAFDSLFFSPDGWLVEGGRSSIFVRLAGRWYTPPVAEGALPGVMRAELLDDPAWGAAERRIHRRELASAEAVVVTNALRGALQAALYESAPETV